MSSTFTKESNSSSSIFRLLPISVNCVFWYITSGGADTEVWNRVYMIAPVKKFGRVRLSTIFLQNKYGGESRHGGTMSFCSVLSFPASKHQEKVFKNIFNGIFGHQRRDIWTVHRWLQLSWFSISASSVIYKLREFSSKQPSLHLLYFSTYCGIKNSLPYPKHMLRAHYNIIIVEVKLMTI